MDKKIDNYNDSWVDIGGSCDCVGFPPHISFLQVKLS